MIELIVKEMVVVIKIINLDTEVFTEKIMMTLIFKINRSDIYIIITLINQDTIMLFQIIILVFKFLSI